MLVGLMTAVLPAYDTGADTTTPFACLMIMDVGLSVVGSMTLLKVTEALSLVGILIDDAAGATVTITGRVESTVAAVVNDQAQFVAIDFPDRS